MKVLGNELKFKGNDVAVKDGTLQTNLNADKLDGYDASSFLKTTDVGTGAGDMMKSVYDSDNDGVVDRSKTADSLSTSGTTSQYLRGDNTWATPPNTTYSAMSVTEGQTGTATSSRTIRADYLKQIIEYHSSASTKQDAITIGTTAPTTPSVNALWIDTN